MSFHTETTLAGYARTAVSLKTRMDAYCRSSGGRHYLTTFADAFHDNAYPGQAPTPDLIDAVHRLAGSAWRIGEPYVLAPAMTAIVAAAAADALDLAGETLHDEVAPGDFGVAVPARPELRPQPPRTPHRHRRDHLGPAVGAQRQRVGDRRLVRARRPRRPGDRPAQHHPAPPAESAPLPRPVPARRHRPPAGRPAGPRLRRPDRRRGGPGLGARAGRPLHHRHHRLPHLGVHRHRLRVLAHPGPTVGHRRTRTPGPAGHAARRARVRRARHPGGDAAPHQPARRPRRGRSQVALPGPVRRARPLATPGRQTRPAVPVSTPTSKAPTGHSCYTARRSPSSPADRADRSADVGRAGDTEHRRLRCWRRRTSDACRPFRGATSFHTSQRPPRNTTAHPPKGTQ